jgi:hypothetical protein
MGLPYGHLKVVVIENMFLYTSFCGLIINVSSVEAVNRNLLFHCTSPLF